MVNRRTLVNPGGARDAHLSLDPISFIFMQILANILPKNGWLPLGAGNPLWEILDSPLKGNIKIYRLFSVIPANCCIRFIILGYQYRKIGVFVVGYSKKEEITQFLHTKTCSTLRAHNASSVFGPSIN